jgi:hypothetical protein
MRERMNVGMVFFVSSQDGSGQLRIIPLICGTSTDSVILSGANPFLVFELNVVKSFVSY